MRDLRPRPSAPAALADGNRDERRDWYQNLRRPDGRIRDRWGQDEIRDALSAISEGCCSWCGERLGRGWEVDHYLPSEKFPELAYHWENLLPSCGACNGPRKRAWSPPDLIAGSLIDPALDETDGRTHYKPSDLLPTVATRLVEPTVDNPAKHMTFQVEKSGYQHHTEVGKATRERLFHEQDKAFAQRMAKVSNNVHWTVSRAKDPDDLREALERLVALIGGRFYVETYARFWVGLLRPPEWRRALPP